MSRTKTFTILFVPVFVMMAWTAYQASIASLGEKVRVAVDGFDPRDLMSGHYLRYQLRLAQGLCEKRHGETCVCLEPQGDLHGAGWVGNCGARPACRHFLRGQCDGFRFDANLERYYFPETFQKQLAMVPKNASVELSLNGRGGALVTGFFVDNEPLLDWVTKSPEQRQ